VSNQSPAYYDLDTVALLRGALDDAWASLKPGQRATISRTLLAESILREAAMGERDPNRLIEAALVAASQPAA
jgi:hypothetical protein